MKCILPCAGYATRLFPLTENFPKALLPIEEGKPILDYILNEVNTIDQIDEIYLISNARYYDLFVEWVNQHQDNKKPIHILNDNTRNLEDRLGAIGDIAFCINQEKIDDDIIIIAGDNLFDYPLKGVIDFYNQKNAPVVCGTRMDDIERTKQMAVAKLDEQDKLTYLVEKPNQPESNIVIYATYVYPKSVVPYINQYLKEGNKPDAPGYLLEYLYKIMPVYVYKFEGTCYDIGTHEALKEVRELYRNGK